MSRYYYTRMHGGKVDRIHSSYLCSIFGKCRIFFAQKFVEQLDKLFQLDATPRPSKSHLRVLTLVWILLLLPLVAGCSANNQGVGATPTVTAATTWSSQYSFALQNAQQVDKNAVLLHVFATPLDVHSANGQYTSVALDFDFLEPATSTNITASQAVATQVMQVSFVDISPTLTLKVNPKFAINGSGLTAADIQAEQKAVEYVRITPMEAIQSTLPMGKAYSTVNGVDPVPNIVLAMNPTFPNHYQVPAVWFVIYPGKGKQLTITLDASSGRELDQRIS